MKPFEDLGSGPGRDVAIVVAQMLDYDPSLQKRGLAPQIDNLLDAEGEYQDLAYRSAVFYVTRRLIMTARQIFRELEETKSVNDIRFTRALRRYLLYDLNLPEGGWKQKLEVLLAQAVRESRKRPSTNKRKRLLKELRDRDTDRCYICGVELDFNTDDSSDCCFPELEHVWPSSLGGNDEVENFLLACHRCNGKKGDEISYPDSHFEKIVYLCGADGQPRSFRWKHRVTFLGKSRHRCQRCKKEAKYYGELTLARLNQNQSWHLLNVEAFCEDHIPSSAE